MNQFQLVCTHQKPKKGGRMKISSCNCRGKNNKHSDIKIILLAKH